MKKRMLWVGIIAILLVVAVGGLFFVQNDYRMEELSVSIPGPSGVLEGLLVLPLQRKAPVGLVVFVHGDGPVDASYDGGYRPLWERLAQAGYASLSWSKPGIGGSQGNWLDQSMSDRAQEVVVAMRWAQDRPEIDPDSIGLWGASQAGWVIPEVAQTRLPAFVILVAPAINWVEQGKYNTRMTLRAQGASADTIAAHETRSARVLELLAMDASYDKYRTLAGHDAMTEKRWHFVKTNWRADASSSISSLACPVLLVLGGRDINVDSADTQRVYERQMPKGFLSVTLLPEADHSMLREAMTQSPLLATAASLFFPRQLFVPEYADTIVDFVSKRQLANP